MASWDFLITDRFGNGIAELTDATSRKVSKPLNKIVSGSFVLPVGHSLVNTCRQMDQTLVKAYRNGVIQGVGPITNFQRVRSDRTGSMSVSWAGAGWRLGNRIIESSKTPAGVTYGTPSVFVNRGTIASTFITELNTAPLVVTLGGSLISVVNIANPAPGGQVNPLPQCDTGIRVGYIDAAIPVTYVGPWYYKNALQALIELSAALDGFDWNITPTEPTMDATGLQLGIFNAYVAIGSTKPNVVFEFGDGKRNVASFSETGDVAGSINRAYSLPTGFPDTASTVNTFLQYDYASMVNRGIVYEDVIQSDLVTNDMRNRLLQANMDVRSTPREVITFAPTNAAETGVMPNYGTEYSEGDIVGFRAVENGKETINDLFRIYQVDFDIADNGDETATPTLVQQ